MYYLGQGRLAAVDRWLDALFGPGEAGCFRQVAGCTIWARGDWLL